MVDIYQHKSRFKIGVVILALTLGLASLVYTTLLVNRLAQREKKLINLYAQALEFAVSPDVEDDLTFLLQEVISSNNSIPVILVKEDNIINYRNIKIPENASEERKQKILEKELQLMKEQYPPIIVDFDADESKDYIYYRNSNLFYQLRYYPYVQLVVVGIFGYLTYLAFSYSRRAEQNRVWVGLAKETAHQLGTPISSLLAWIDYMKIDEDFDKDEIIMELYKDIKRLEVVTARFSSIGSEPQIYQEDVYFLVLGASNYLQRRFSKKIKWEVENHLKRGKALPLNRHLFEWVIENIAKNAADAIGATEGKIKISLQELPEGDVLLEIQDSGKGIPKALHKKVFNPGYTTKKRGWGLGLTLTKRIIEEYHQGKIYIKAIEEEKGTTFCIHLNAELPITKEIKKPQELSTS